MYERDLNQLPASLVPFSQAKTPYPLFQHTYLYQNGAVQEYNAFTAAMNTTYAMAFRFAADGHGPRVSPIQTRPRTWKGGHSSKTPTI